MSSAKMNSQPVVQAARALRENQSFAHKLPGELAGSERFWFISQSEQQLGELIGLNIEHSRFTEF